MIAPSPAQRASRLRAFQTFRGSRRQSSEPQAATAWTRSAKFRFAPPARSRFLSRRIDGLPHAHPHSLANDIRDLTTLYTC